MKLTALLLFITSICFAQKKPETFEQQLAKDSIAMSSPTIVMKLRRAHKQDSLKMVAKKKQEARKPKSQK